jgi:hypothetical protein
MVSDESLARLVEAKQSDYALYRGKSGWDSPARGEGTDEDRSEEDYLVQTVL